MKISELKKIGDYVFYFCEDTYKIRRGKIEGIKPYQLTGDCCLFAEYLIGGERICGYIDEMEDNVKKHTFSDEKKLLGYKIIKENIIKEIELLTQRKKYIQSFIDNFKI